MTGAGPAAIAVIRVRGPRAAGFIERHIRMRRKPFAESWQAGAVCRAELLDAGGAALDDILVSIHAAPPAWDLRLHLHGNAWLVGHCAALLRGCGLEPCAEERSTLWPAADVLEAEAWARLPRMLTLRGARWLLAQVERLRAVARTLADQGSLDAARQVCRQIAAGLEIVAWFTRPLRVVLAGPPNAGKSTLANALADRPVSVVSATPGTTRDWVEAGGEACGFPVTWLDTAGLREAADALEAASVARTRRLMAEADAILLVLDATSAARAAQVAFLATHDHLRPACTALTKTDIAGLADTDALRELLPAAWRAQAIAVSGMLRTGLDALCDALLTGAGRTQSVLDDPAAYTARQVQVLDAAAQAADRKSFTDNILHLAAPADPL